MKVSIIMITIDRYEQTKKTLDKILNNTGYEDFELLVADNGSTDERVIDYIKSLNPAVHLINGENKGVARTLNQLILRAKGDLIVHTGNDIDLPDGWLKGLLDCHKAIPNTGIAAIHTVEKLYPVQEVNGVGVHVGKRIFGTKMFSRKLIDKIGYYREDYHPYGMEDSDLSLRSHYSGMINYYIPSLRARHEGHDCGQDTEYRKMKNESLIRNSKIFEKLAPTFKEGKNLYVNKPKLWTTNQDTSPIKKERKNS
jgi:glycosyltransferase involved in cell wall biosynthesis